ncbi:MAG: beta-propeller fold lactonase family protein [Planctomycetes bacterium]|nr:beta-propeller fold lactonase family protein [Planctomycetota bacterium]
MPSLVCFVLGATISATAGIATTPSAPRDAGGTLVVLNKTDATASFLDARSGEALAVVGTGIGPHEAAVPPGEELVVVCDYGAQTPGNTLTLIDVAHRVPIGKIELGEYRRPHGIAFASAERCYVTCEQNQALVEVDVAARKVVRALPTEQQLSHMVALAPDGTRAFVANIGPGTVSALDLATGKVLSKIECGKGSEGIDVSPDGRVVWVANREADTLSIVDAAGLKEDVELPIGDFPIRVKATPNGKFVLVSNAQAGDVVVLDATTREVRARIGMGTREGDPVDERMFGSEFGSSPVPVGILITPDSTHAYVANTNADAVTVIDLESFEISGRFRTGRQPDGLAWLTR